MEVVLENNDTAPEIVEQTMSTASDFGAASANVVSETIQATADTVAAVTSEVVETASTRSSRQHQPQLWESGK